MNYINHIQQLKKLSCWYIKNKVRKELFTALCVTMVLRTSL